MKAITFTTRNVLAGERDEAGAMVLRTVGDVTVTLEGMLPAELGEWEWAAADLNTRGWDEAQFLLTVRGWKVMQAGEVVGVLLQGAGTRVHVEWYDAVNGDFFAAALTRNLRQGAAQVVNARQAAGQGLAVDVEPEPYQAPTGPTWLPDDTAVRYTGTYAMTFADCGVSDFTVRGCDCDVLACRGYELWTSGHYEPVVLHVHPDHVTPVEEPVAA